MAKWLYKKVKVSDHPYADKRGYILYHRSVMEKSLGRFLLPSEHVHHKDGDPTNNRLENLEVVHKSVHALRHPRERAVVVLVCAYCGREFQRDRRLVSKQSAKNFCSRSHSALYYGKEKPPNRKNDEDVPHGTQSRYRRGCRCAVCRSAHAARHREYRKNKRSVV